MPPHNTAPSVDSEGHFVRSSSYRWGQGGLEGTHLFGVLKMTLEGIGQAEVLSGALTHEVRAQDRGYGGLEIRAETFQLFAALQPALHIFSVVPTPEM